jgi:hypothetical protein
MPRTHQGQLAKKEGVLGLVKGDWPEPTTRGKEYYEYLRLAERACFILRMRLSPLAEDKVKDIDSNDPQRIYNDLKQEFEPDTAANRLDKLNKFLNALQSTGESTVRFGGRVRGLLREWSELWPAGYSLIKLKEELWMHVVLRGLGPSFQHIRNGYAGAEKQDATTLKRLLDSNDAMDSATGLQTAFAAQAPLPVLSMPRVACFAHALPLCSTASGVRLMAITSQRSAATCSARRSSAKPTVRNPSRPPAKASHSKPRSQMLHLQSLLVKQVASSLPQTPPLITPGTQTQGPRAT